jgi:hypothetical protein
VKAEDDAVTLAARELRVATRRPTVVLVVADARVELEALTQGIGVERAVAPEPSVLLRDVRRVDGRKGDPLLGKGAFDALEVLARLHGPTSHGIPYRGPRLPPARLNPELPGGTDGAPTHATGGGVERPGLPL